MKPSFLLFPLVWLLACSAGAEGTGGAPRGGAPTGGDATGGAGGLSGGGGSGGVAPCGNGAIDADEACDGDDFQGKTCADFDYDFGELVCDSICQISTVGCRRNEKCDSWGDVDKDGLFGCEDPDCADATWCVDSCSAAFVSPLTSNGLQILGGTKGYPSAEQPSCTAESGPELIHAFAPTIDATLDVSLSSDFGDDFSLSVRTACGDVASELACTHDGTTAVDQVLSIPVVKDQTYYLFIDGATPFDSGPFSALLLLTPL